MSSWLIYPGFLLLFTVFFVFVVFNFPKYPPWTSVFCCCCFWIVTSCLLHILRRNSPHGHILSILYSTLFPSTPHSDSDQPSSWEPKQHNPHPVQLTNRCLWSYRNKAQCHWAGAQMECVCQATAIFYHSTNDHEALRALILFTKIYLASEHRLIQKIWKWCR